MKKIILNSILLLTINSVCSAQILVNKLWEQQTGVTDTANFSPLIQTSTGDIIVSGNEKISGQMTNFRTSKINPNGSSIWVKTFNNTPSKNDFATAATKDNLGNTYVAGASFASSINNLDLTVIKYNSAGIQQFIQYYNGPGNNYDVATGIVVDASGNIFVTGASIGAGFAQLDYVTIKLNSTGTIQWTSRYNFSNGIDIPTSITLDNSGNPVISGSSASSLSNSNSDFATLKYNASNGSQIAVQRQANAGTTQDKLTAQTKDAAGNLYVTGATSSNGINFDIQTIKYDNNMNVIWVQTYDGYTMDDIGNSIAIDNLGNVIVGGYSDKPAAQKEMVLLKYSNSGSLIWTKKKQPQNNTGIAAILKVVVDNNNDIFVGGHYTLVNQDVVVLKYNTSGDILFEKTYNGIGNNTDKFFDLTADGNFFTISGRTMNGLTQSNFVARYETKNFSPQPAGTSQSFSKNIVLAGFNPNVLKYNNVNNRNITFGVLSDFVADSTCAKIDAYLSNKFPNDFEGKVNSGQFLVNKIVPWQTQADTLSQSRMGDIVAMPKGYSYFAIQVPTTFTTKAVADTLKNVKPDVFTSQLDYWYVKNDVPNDVFYFGFQASLHPTSSWPNAHINAETAWDISKGKSFIKAGVFDTGIDGSHVDLTGSLGQGFDFISNSSGGNLDIDGHGTACFGIIGATRNNGPTNSSGIAGIAGGDFATGQQGVTLCPMRIAFDGFTNGDFSSQKMFNSYTMGAASIGAGGLGLHVMSNSFGFKLGAYDAMAVAGINSANRNGVAWVGSRGNNADNETNVPGTLKEQIIMCVGASGTDLHRADGSPNGDQGFNSMYGYPMDFLAPGVTTVVSTTGLNNIIIKFNGTSASAPHVAGVSALMMSYYNQPTANWDNLVHEDCEAILKRTCTDFNSPVPSYSEAVGYDLTTGHGRINAGLALQSIEQPKYKIRHIDPTHYSTSSSNVTNVVYNGNLFWPAINNIAAGFYVTKIIEVTFTINYNIGTNEVVKGAWPLYKASHGWPFNSYVVTDEPWHVELLSYNNNQATLKTYIYQIVSNQLGQTINQFFPVGPLQINTAFSLWTQDMTYSSIEEKDLQVNNLVVYPNPTNSNFNIKINAGNDNKVNYTVTDILGKTITTQENVNINKGINIIPVNNLNVPAGIYFININLTNQNYPTQKIIIK